ncbi:MAG TPA: PAS domain-containing protein [Alphaproteobacteria bacterium]|nr:PAS domain-containing protein [Alphaproteobacteria bacterium]
MHPDPDAFAAAIECPILRRLFAYWRDRAGGRAMPRRDEIDPLDFPFAIGRVTLVEVAAPGRYRFRLWSENNLHFTGVEMTGKWLDDYPEPENRAMLARSYDELCATARPQRRLRDLVIFGQRRSYEAVLMPLGQDGAVEMLLIGVTYCFDETSAPTIRSGITRAAGRVA